MQLTSPLNTWKIDPSACSIFLPTPHCQYRSRLGGLRASDEHVPKPSGLSLLLLFGASRYMVNRRSDMRRIRDVLHYCLDKKFSNRQIARVTGISHTATAKYVKRFSEAGMSWPLPDDVDDLSLIHI